MKPVVIDASALVAWLLGDVPSIADAVARAITQAAAAPLLAPQLMRVEVANALAVAVRRGRINTAQSRHAASIADALPIQFDPRADDVVSLLTTAAGHGLTAYDAIYLQLAMTRNAALLTADRALEQAAGRAGVESASAGAA